MKMALMTVVYAGMRMTNIIYIVARNYGMIKRIVRIGKIMMNKKPILNIEKETE